MNQTVRVTVLKDFIIYNRVNYQTGSKVIIADDVLGTKFKKGAKLNLREHGVSRTAGLVYSIVDTDQHMTEREMESLIAQKILQKIRKTSRLPAQVGTKKAH